MCTVKCVIDECKSVFTTTEPLAANARFICRNHPRSEQVKAVGRKPSWRDNLDELESFQTYALDPDLKRKGSDGYQLDQESDDDSDN